MSEDLPLRGSFRSSEAALELVLGTLCKVFKDVRREAANDADLEDDIPVTFVNKKKTSLGKKDSTYNINELIYIYINLGRIDDG